MSVVVLDLFSGAGGFSEGARRLGIPAYGIDSDADACATHEAAGHRTRRADIAMEKTGPFTTFFLGGYSHLHLHASPPCTTFSRAGRGAGRKYRDELCAAVSDALSGRGVDLPDEIDDVTRLVLEEGLTEERRNPGSWEHLRPATTVQGDPRIWPPGHKVNQVDRDRNPDADERYGDRAGKNARRVTIAEAAVLQGFRPDYPFQGTKTSQFRQVGNAVPPPMAAAVLRSLL